MRANLAAFASFRCTFTPASSLYASQRCGGVNIIVTDRNALDAPEVGLEIAAALHKLYPDANTKSLGSTR